MAVLTYIAPFILDYAGFADRSLSLVLGASGVAGVSAVSTRRYHFGIILSWLLPFEPTTNWNAR